MLFISQIISFLIISMAVKGSPSQACAACKYQRRRCTPECPLAPHFPADQPKIFQNAHRLFGVANMSRILKQVRDDQREDAMQSIKYESNMWERFPYLGCCAVIWQLREQIQAYEAEVCYVRSLIEMVRSRNHDHTTTTLEEDSRTPPPWLQFKQLSIDPNSTIRNDDDEHGNVFSYSQKYDEGTSYETVEMKPLWPYQQQQQQQRQQSRDVHHLLVSQRECENNALGIDDTQDQSDLSNGSQLKDRIQSSVKGASQNELKNSEAWFNLTSMNR